MADDRLPIERVDIDAADDDVGVFKMIFLM